MISSILVIFHQPFDVGGNRCGFENFLKFDLTGEGGVSGMNGLRKIIALGNDILQKPICTTFPYTNRQVNQTSKIYISKMQHKF